MHEAPHSDDKFKRCSSCVLAGCGERVRLDAAGKCGLCAAPPRPGKPLLESDLLRLLASHRGKGGYDCLLLCSGGRDSVSSLYYARKRYRLNPLVLTFDNGFEHPVAVANARRAAEKLGADWLYYRSPLMREMYAEALRGGEGFPLCALCSLWYMGVVYDTAERYKLPLIIAGWTAGQASPGEADPAFAALCEGVSPFVERMRAAYPKYAAFPRSMEELRRGRPFSRKAEIASPHWFLDGSPEDYGSLMARELGWEPVGYSYPAGSTNCPVSLLGSWLSLKRYGFTHFHVEMSSMIRAGKLGREEALKKLELDLSGPGAAAALKPALDALGLTPGELGLPWEGGR